MENVTVLLGFLVALSLATERITETIKGIPFLSLWLAVERPSGSTAEEFRKASIHILAIGVGTFLASLTREQLAVAVGVEDAGFWVWLLFGAMASGGSGLWNSALDIVREVNKRKQLLVQQLKAKPPAP